MIEDLFDEWVRSNEPRLRRALVAARGPEAGSDATASALVYAWENWDRVASMESPVGYLYRVGLSSLRQRKRGGHLELATPDSAMPWIEPGLPGAMGRLSERQRAAVVLVHGFGWTLEEGADVLDVSVSTVRNHVRRGMAKLRDALEVATGA